MGTVIAIVYTLWAIYSGYKVMSHRSDWGKMNIVFKVVLVVIVGYLVGAFYFIHVVLKLLGFLER